LINCSIVHLGSADNYPSASVVVSHSFVSSRPNALCVLILHLDCVGLGAAAGH
jgi:hypothetical protein